MGKCYPPGGRRQKVLGRSIDYLNDLEALESQVIKYNTYAFIGLNSCAIITNQNVGPACFVFYSTFFLMDFPIGHRSICITYSAYTPYLCP